MHRHMRTTWEFKASSNGGEGREPSYVDYTVDMSISFCRMRLLFCSQRWLYWHTSVRSVGRGPDTTLRGFITQAAPLWTPLHGVRSTGRDPDRISSTGRHTRAASASETSALPVICRLHGRPSPVPCTQPACMCTGNNLQISRRICNSADKLVVWPVSDELATYAQSHRRLVVYDWPGNTRRPRQDQDSFQLAYIQSSLSILNQAVELAKPRRRCDAPTLFCLDRHYHGLKAKAPGAATKPVGYTGFLSAEWNQVNFKSSQTPTVLKRNLKHIVIIRHSVLTNSHCFSFSYSLSVTYHFSRSYCNNALMDFFSVSEALSDFNLCMYVSCMYVCHSPSQPVIYSHPQLQTLHL